MFRNPTSNMLVKKITVDGTNYSLTAGTGDTSNSTVVDTQGYEGVVFVLDVGAVTATGTVDTQVQQGAASNMSDGADLLGSNSTQLTASDDDKLIMTTICRPQERYVRCQTIRATANAVINALHVYLFGPTWGEVTVDSRTVSDEIHVTPAEGTA